MCAVEFVNARYVIGNYLKTQNSKPNSAWQCLPLQVKSCLLKLYFTDFKQRYKLVKKVIDCTFEEFKWVAWVIRSRWVIAVDPNLPKDFEVPWLEITGKTLLPLSVLLKFHFRMERILGYRQKNRNYFSRSHGIFFGSESFECSRGRFIGH